MAATALWPQHSRSQTFDIPAWGSVFRIEVTPSLGKSFRLDLAESMCFSVLNRYNTVLSDWSPSSELRKFESKDLTTWTKPDPLLFKALMLSQEAYLQTSGLFDITVGAYLWEGLKPTSLEGLLVDTQNQKVKFKKHPKRLTFGGIAKGMVLGELAYRFYLSGVSGVYIEGSGGGSVELRTQDNLLIFKSHSHNLKPENHNKLHIFNPHILKKTSKSKYASVECQVSLDADFIYAGAMSDVYSTAYVLNSDFKLPEFCRLVSSEI
jgi:hypothetical protein